MRLHYLALTVLLLTLATVGIAAQERPPTLADAIKTFNAQAAEHSIGKSRPSLTEEEVVAALRWKLLDRKEINISDDTAAQLEKMLKTGEMPAEFQFEKLTGYQPNTLVEFDVWSVRLRVPSATGGTFAITIREQMIASHLIGPEERKVVEAFNREGDPGSFQRVERAKRYKAERAKAAELDRANQEKQQ